MLWERLRRNPWLIDVLLVSGLVVFAGVWAKRSGDGSVALPLAIAQALPLLLRRRFPVLTLALVVAATIPLTVQTHSLNPLPPFLAFYSVAAHTNRRTGLIAGAIGLAALIAPVLYETDYGFAPFIFHVLVFPAAWVLGDSLRTRRAYYDALEERAARLERERDEEAKRAVAQEQARIARELHDVLAHNVSVMVVQAAAAGDVFDSHPGRAREALRSIEQTGRSALEELRRLLGAVRTEDAELAPQPGLSLLPELVEQVRSAGLAVDLRVDGRPRTLGPGLDLAAYRVVQEALTNTLKHAHASSANVHVLYERGRVELVVADDGVGSANGSGPGGGRGLIGMRERVALYGGELETAPRPGGGFVVRATLPAETT